ncbi:type I polyketide synthase [Aspergillus udagawae]|uniref:PKS/NRPS-like protein biosynthetic cluster n=1 Tax=Aspergillus udagawae TaxID=91492 RepID=A0A8E0UUC8_9EURO|nr:putative PKS/NRPS-like protein biosynthetic cluster [Aspergillus udagawae]GIC84208.1 putative PKS/NRPS-like protein biosynthetic cluster [Aspergillus udagawae]
MFHLHQQLNSDGYQVDLVGWGEKLPASQDIVSLLDLEVPFFDGITKENLALFYKQSKITQRRTSSQIRPQDPRFAQVLGMARTLRPELGVPFATLEMQDFGPGSMEAICLLLRKIQRRTAEPTEVSEFDPDQEFAWTNGVIHVSRMYWLSIPEAGGSFSTATLEIGRPGLLNTLRCAPQPMKPLQPDEVRVKTMSVSMNYRELLVAMGVVPNEGQEVVGTDAGIVTAAGANVTNVSVGDRVMAISVAETSYTTELQLSSQLCARIPDDCGFQDASTLPTIYLTVLRTLREKVNLRGDQTVLIHSAAGGVGIAAIHYAKWAGAKIYATVSSPEKTAFLVEKMGVPKENIFYSRDSNFLDAVMRSTDGRGVGVVLNSLSGELLRASWQCVAEGGSMIEISKRDLLCRAQLAMSPFLANRSYIGVDIATLPLIEPTWVQEHLVTIVDLYSQGIIHPVRPITTFPANQVEDAFRHLQKGQHIGKLCIQFSDSPDLRLVPSVAELELRADRAYLFVGGMRGIGVWIARWMVSHGAKNLVFLSRSAGEKEEDRALVRELSEMGCQALTFAGDVADLATVQRVVSSIAMPIAGVIQLAMVLADTGVMDMDIGKWNAAVRPKVNGTWNLHEALPTDLDFFVMASSLSGIFGNYGQSNYAAANTFLDAFAQFRQSRGLAASTVDLGVVDEIGWVSRNASVHRKVPLMGFRSRNQLLHGLLSKTGIAKGQYIWQRDPRTALSRVHHQEGEVPSGSGEAKGGGLKTFLSAVQDNPEVLHDASSAQVTAKEIARQVSIYTMRDSEQEVDLTLSLQDFGVDSLVSIELRNWWKQAFGADVTVLQLMNSGSFLGLGQKAVDQLKQKYLKP